MPVKRHFLFFVLAALLLASYGAIKDLKGAAHSALAPVSFYDKSEKAVTLDAFKGKVVLVNLWATWCTPCVGELPLLENLQKKLPGDKFALVAISQDITSLPDIQAFLKKRGVKIEPYWDKDRQIPLQWKYRGLPTSFLINAKGQVVRQYDGAFEWDKGATFRQIEELVTGRKPS